MKKIAPCPNCESTEQRLTTTGVPPAMLPDASGWLASPTWDVVVCLECGLTRYFASSDALDNIRKSVDWHRT